MLNTAADGLSALNNFEKEYAKRLGFQRVTDWKRYRASVDLLVDTEYAIHSAFQYQLGDLARKNHDFGEIYIRLYGILNAVYLQMNAFETIANLLNFPDRKQVGPDFRRLAIYKLRGMAAAHTTDYLNDNEDLSQNSLMNKRTSFRVIQSRLQATGDDIQLLDENGILTRFNLIRDLTEYECIAKNLLIKLIEHSIKTRYPNKEHRLRIKSSLYKMLPLLIYYSNINCNKKYLQKQDKQVKRLIGAIDLINIEEVKRLFPEFEKSHGL